MKKLGKPDSRQKTLMATLFGSGLGGAASITLARTTQSDWRQDGRLDSFEAFPRMTDIPSWQTKNISCTRWIYSHDVVATDTLTYSRQYQQDYASYTYDSRLNSRATRLTWTVYTTLYAAVPKPLSALDSRSLAPVLRALTLGSVASSDRHLAMDELFRTLVKPDEIQAALQQLELEKDDVIQHLREQGTWDALQSSERAAINAWAADDPLNQLTWQIVFKTLKNYSDSIKRIALVQKLTEEAAEARMQSTLAQNEKPLSLGTSDSFSMN